MQHKERIQRLYADCLAGLGKQGGNGEVLSLRYHIRKALDEGVNAAVIEEWLRTTLWAHEARQGGQER